jgi:hypothetical protein
MTFPSGRDIIGLATDLPPLSFSFIFIVKYISQANLSYEAVAPFPTVLCYLFPVTTGSREGRQGTEMLSRDSIIFSSVLRTVAHVCTVAQSQRASFV